MELYLALAIPILIATAWLYTAQVTRTSLPTLKNKRICLLIAHPDDEAMFFAPTILALTAPGLENHLKILCMSNGELTDLSAPLPEKSIDLLLKATPMAWETYESKSSHLQPPSLDSVLRLTSWYSRTPDFLIA